MLTPEDVDLIVESLAAGMSLRQICREQDWKESTVRLWIAKDDEIAAQYAHARELQADVIFDDILDIADGNGEHADKDVNERRLQIDTRKWMAGRLKGKYSDKVKHVGGGPEDDPIQVEHDVTQEAADAFTRSIAGLAARD